VRNDRRMSEIEIRSFDASDTDWLTDQHQTLYTRDEGFDDSFGPLVRSILEAFATSHDPKREAGWVVEVDGHRAGSIFCVRLTETTAKLRLFLLTSDARGQGIGKQLLQTCMRFAKASGYSDMTLWTHESHKNACALYTKAGWQLGASKPVRSFGQDLVEQTWTVTL